MTRSLSAPGAPETPGRRRLWLVRHGETAWNASGLVQGQRDPGLTSKGRAQAGRCARSLVAGREVEALYSSDLRRALETAAPLAEALELPVRVEPGLRERALGDAEGLPSALLGPSSSGVELGRVVDADAAPEGGETVRQLYERVALCATRLVASHRKDVVLVCHGGVVRVLLAWIDGVTPEEMTWPEIDNGVPIVRSLPSALIGA
ncbi:MAG: histidine phosphatase family protein [Actinomycetota bacterium]|nr:histidine phosphatase family protein [Actinomycetota bacterium]